MQHSLPPIAEVLAHRGASLLLDELLDFDAESARAACRVRADAWYADAHGAMPGWIGLELMAQTVAAHVSMLSRRLQQPPRPGALLGTRRFDSRCAAWEPGTDLRIHARVRYRDESGLGAYDCSIECARAHLARATLTLFEPPDFGAFLAGTGVRR